MQLHCIMMVILFCLFPLESYYSVDAMAAITLEELLKEVRVYPEKLNDSISDDHLRKIALFLTSWRTVASQLDLDQNDLDDAEQGGRIVKDKSLKALLIWRGKFGFKATYRKLVEVLLTLAMADVAEKVCKLLKGMWYTSSCVCVCVCVCVRVCVHVRARACVCVCMCVHAHMYV